MKHDNSNKFIVQSWLESFLSIYKCHICVYIYVFTIHYLRMSNSTCTYCAIRNNYLLLFWYSSRLYLLNCKRHVIVWETSWVPRYSPRLMYYLYNNRGAKLVSKEWLKLLLILITICYWKSRLNWTSQKKQTVGWTDMFFIFFCM